MALALTRKEGSGFIAAGKTVVVTAIRGLSECTVEVRTNDGSAEPVSYAVNDKRATEVAKDVLLSVGIDSGWNGWVKLLIAAPKTIGISRYEGA